MYLCVHPQKNKIRNCNPGEVLKQNDRAGKGSQAIIKCITLRSGINFVQKSSYKGIFIEGLLNVMKQGTNRMGNISPLLLEVEYIIYSPIEKILKLRKATSHISISIENQEIKKSQVKEIDTGTEITSISQEDDIHAS